MLLASRKASLVAERSWTLLKTISSDFTSITFFTAVNRKTTAFKLSVLSLNAKTSWCFNPFPNETLLRYINSKLEKRIYQTFKPNTSPSIWKANKNFSLSKMCNGSHLLTPNNEIVQQKLKASMNAGLTLIATRSFGSCGRSGLLWRPKSMHFRFISISDHKQIGSKKLILFFTISLTVSKHFRYDKNTFSTFYSSFCGWFNLLWFSC